MAKREMLKHYTRLFIVYTAFWYNVVYTQPCRRAGKNCVQRTGAPVTSDVIVVPNNGADGDNAQIPDEKPRKRCCPYDFDSSRCKVVDDRVLCGYNRNGGWPQSRDLARELSDGCRLRNGRLECGYVEEPYHNLRRPPAWDRVRGANDVAPNDNVNGAEGKEDIIIENPDVEIIDIEKLNNKWRSTRKTLQYTKPKPNCVDIDNRIVCKPIT